MILDHHVSCAVFVGIPHVVEVLIILSSEGTSMAPPWSVVGRAGNERQFAWDTEPTGALVHDLGALSNCTRCRVRPRALFCRVNPPKGMVTTLLDGCGHGQRAE